MVQEGAFILVGKQYISDDGDEGIDRLLAEDGLVKHKNQVARIEDPSGVWRYDALSLGECDGGCVVAYVGKTIAEVDAGMLQPGAKIQLRITPEERPAYESMLRDVELAFPNPKTFIIKAVELYEEPDKP